MSNIRNEIPHSLLYRNLYFIEILQTWIKQKARKKYSFVNKKRKRFIICNFIICNSFFQVEQYFRSLPQNKIPKIGSPGEKYRDKQLVFQLPKQDLALSYCKNVEPKDHQSYEDFINARNEIALDIAYVKESATSNTVSIFSLQ